MTLRRYSSRSQQTTLSGAITSGATTMTVVSGSALLGGVDTSSLSTSATFTVVIDPDTAVEEIVDVTQVSTNTFTIVRSIDTVGGAQSHSAGAVVRHMAIGRDYRDANLHAEADASYNDGSGNAHSMHGIGAGEGVVVGTLKAQTLTQKTLTTPTINGGTIAGAVTVSATATVSGHIVVSGGSITGLSSAGMVTSSATPKDYVDSILGSATAASTSAASAALSASQAATSAASASVSAIAASTSAAQASVSQIAANTSAIAASTSAANASASAIAASTSAVNASTSAANASASQVAANTSAVNASTSAANASASATAANNSAIAASTSAANASASAIAASTSAAQASASASAASVSQIAASTSAANASASAAAASVSQIAANTSAIAAATSAAAASASEVAANTSAIAASTSAANAAASYDSFDDRYLGAKSTPPTVDNDGNPLLTGALYWSTSANQMYVWSGTAWGEISSTAQIFRYKYTAAGGETSESGPDDNGLTLSYIVGKEQVYLNGVLLVRGTDYTATNGTSIASLSPALSANDVLEIITFTAFDLATALNISLLQAKGDLISASAASTPARVALGTNGQYLKVDTSTTSGLAWSTVDALPSQTGNSGKYLTTNGTTASWAAITTDPTATVFLLMGA